MPKGRSKRKKEKLPPVAIDSTSPDEDSESVCSSLDGASVRSEEVTCGGVGGGEEEEVEEDLEFQLAELIDQLADKNSRVRLEALSSLNKILSKETVSEHLMGRRETLLELISKGLKKASGRERCDLARLAMVVVVQMGMDHPEFQIALRPLATQLAQDHTVPPSDRAEIITLLGFATFVQAADLLEVEHVMRMLEDLFRKPKQEVSIVCAALHSWSLLLSIAPQHLIPALFTSLLPVFNKLLERVELNVRLAVGLGVALLFELARECSSEDIDVLDSPESSDSYSLIEQLATESNRHTARKDRNQIRSCFRDILSSLDDGSVPEKSIKLGVEVLLLDSWAKLCQYNTFRDLLGPGMNTHLKQNDLLRDIFQMGPVPLYSVESKASKLERKYANAALAKHRTQSRGKQRDKRAVV